MYFRSILSLVCLLNSCIVHLHSSWWAPTEFRTGMRNVDNIEQCTSIVLPHACKRHLSNVANALGSSLPFFIGRKQDVESGILAPGIVQAVSSISPYLLGFSI